MLLTGVILFILIIFGEVLKKQQRTHSIRLHLEIGLIPAQATTRIYCCTP